MGECSHRFSAHRHLLAAVGLDAGRNGCIPTLTYQQVGGVASTSWIRVAQFAVRLYLGGGFIFLSFDRNFFSPYRHIKYLIVIATDQMFLFLGENVITQGVQSQVIALRPGMPGQR